MPMQIKTGDCFSAWIEEKGIDSIILCYAQKAYDRTARGRVIEGYVINGDQTIWFNNGYNCRNKYRIIPIKIQNCRKDYNEIIEESIQKLKDRGLICTSV